MAGRNEPVLLPYVVELDGEAFDVHPDGKVYRRVRPRVRKRKVHETAETFRTETATLRRVKDPDLIRRVLEAAEGVSWTDGVRL